MEFEAQMRMLDSAGYRTGYAYRNPNLLRRPLTEVSWPTGGTSQQHEGSLSATGFLSGTTVAPDASDVDDVTAANQAGAKQISEWVLKPCYFFLGIAPLLLISPSRVFYRLLFLIRSIGTSVWFVFPWLRTSQFLLTKYLTGVG